MKSLLRSPWGHMSPLKTGQDRQAGVLEGTEARAGAWPQYHLLSVHSLSSLQTHPALIAHSPWGRGVLFL